MQQRRLGGARPEALKDEEGGEPLPYACSLLSPAPSPVIVPASHVTAFPSTSNQSIYPLTHNTVAHMVTLLNRT